MFDENAPVFSKLRRRRTNRWLRKEALKLARQADSFDCPHIRLEARRLLEDLQIGLSGSRRLAI